MARSPLRRYQTTGACGLDCVLCPRYYTEGRTRCAGCGSEISFAAVGCKIFRCCVRENGLESCAECQDFPCDKLEGVDGSDSFVTHRKMLINLRSIKDHGIEPFLEEQGKRRDLLETMLGEYNDGRSKSFLCSAATLLPIEAIADSMEGVKGRASESGIEDDDKKAGAKLLKKSLEAAALREGVDLKLRKSGPERRT